MTVPLNSTGVVRNPSPGCYHPVIKVELFVNKGTGKYAGIHFATVAWEAEEASDGSTWYSGWFAPHNDCGTMIHNENIDMLDLDGVLALVKAFTERRYTEEQVLAMGITNQYVRRSFRRS